MIKGVSLSETISQVGSWSSKC